MFDSNSPLQYIDEVSKLMHKTTRLKETEWGDRARSPECSLSSNFSDKEINGAEVPSSHILSILIHSKESRASERKI